MENGTNMRINLHWFLCVQRIFWVGKMNLKSKNQSILLSLHSISALKADTSTGDKFCCRNISMWKFVHSYSSQYQMKLQIPNSVHLFISSAREELIKLQIFLGTSHPVIIYPFQLFRHWVWSLFMYNTQMKHENNCSTLNFKTKKRRFPILDY